MAASSEKSRMYLGKRSLEHPLHDHALTLREISKDCHVECSLCKQYSSGPTYCCEECDFILHEACAEIELPPQIQGHPSHPRDHMLKLDRENSCYKCPDQKCRVRVGVLTAMATHLPPQGAEEDTINHFRHKKHPLSSFRVETALDAQCGFCDEQIYAGQIYGCRPCLFLLHEACARLPLEIQHPLHRHHPLTFLAEPKLDEVICRVCIRGVESGPAYCCNDCGFALHVRCTLLTMAADNDGLKDQEEEEDCLPCAIKYYFHQHLLTPLHVRHPVPSQVRCSICRLKVSGGEAFACFPCKFFLHKACVEETPKTIKHFLHPQHPSLILQPKDSFKCNLCLEDHSHIAFSCKDCKYFNLDPACALQSLSATAATSHVAHEHPLTLAFTDSDKYTCTTCDQSIDGVAYYCITCKRFWLHRSCAELPLELIHAFHPDHPLILSETPAPNFFCFACYEKHGGLAFYCAKCDFYLGVQCASLNPTLKHPRHEHRLAYYVINPTTRLLQCSFCGKRCRYNFYHCMRCNFSLHGDCLHLPRTVDHIIHSHPLQLRDKYAKDPNECLYCETSRNPEHGVYRCEKCDYSAHIECMVSDYKKEVTGLETCGNDNLNQLNIQIDTLRAEIKIMRRDVEAMEANRNVSVEELAEVGRKWKMVEG